MYLMFICHLNWKTTIYKGRCASLRNLAIELNAPLPSSATYKRMFSSEGLILRPQRTCMSD